MESINEKIDKAVDLIAKARDLMIEAIQQAVNNHKNHEVHYELSVGNPKYGYVVDRYIIINENNELYIVDHFGTELNKVADLSTSELHSICLSL